MPGENFSRRVARAAAVGGGRSYRRQTPVSWYLTLLLICVVGVGLVTYSRYERLHPTATRSKASVPVAPTRANLWQVGLAVDVCGTMKALPATATPGQAFSTDGKGVVTIEPGLAPNPTVYSGKNATLQAFLLQEGVVLTSTSLQLPAKQPATTTTLPSTTSTTAPVGSTTTTTSKSTTTTSTTSPPPPLVYSNGKSCGGKTGVVQVEAWSSPSAKTGSIVKNPASLRFNNGQLITIAFVPKGASIPKPGSALAIANFLVANPGGLAPASVAAGTTTPSIPTTTPSIPTTTNSPGSTTTTGKS